MYYLSRFCGNGVLCSAPSEESEPVRKKSRLDIDILPGDDVHKPLLDIDISDTRKCVWSLHLLKLLIYLILHACDPI